MYKYLIKKARLKYFHYICNIKVNVLTSISSNKNTLAMAKYNITEKKDKEAAYRSLVSPQLMDELEEKINNIIIIQKKYKDKAYSAKQLAVDLNTNTRYISAVVNVRFHMNYTSFVNKYRIQEAMSLLIDKRYKDLNMEDISDMVGFSNRQSFYASFFRINKITPKEYKVLHMTADNKQRHKAKKRAKPVRQSQVRTVELAQEGPQPAQE